MKKIIVPVLMEEYKIIVVVGNTKELANYIIKNCKGWDYEEAYNHLEKTRAVAFDRLNMSNPKYPVITVNSEYSYIEILASLPHEASHCADYIFKFIGATDESGEIRGHIISGTVRIVLKKLLGKKELIVK